MNDTPITTYPITVTVQADIGSGPVTLATAEGEVPVYAGPTIGTTVHVGVPDGAVAKEIANLLRDILDKLEEDDR